MPYRIHFAFTSTSALFPIPHWKCLSTSVVAIQTTEEFRAMIFDPLDQSQKLGEGSVPPQFQNKSAIDQKPVKRLPVDGKEDRL